MMTWEMVRDWFSAQTEFGSLDFSETQGVQDLSDHVCRIAIAKHANLRAWISSEFTRSLPGWHLRRLPRLPSRHLRRLPRLPIARPWRFTGSSRTAARPSPTTSSSSSTAAGFPPTTSQLLRVAATEHVNRMLANSRSSSPCSSRRMTLEHRKFRIRPGRWGAG